MENQFTTSLWGDEGFSAILSMKSDIPTIIRIIINDTSPPLYNITEHIAFRLFGTEEVVIRGLSFFYYCLAILFVYLIGSYLWDKRTGLLAAALSFFNPFFFVYAFEGRMYSIMALGVAASMYFFLRLLEYKKFHRGLFVGYVLATAWALYSHHFAMFAVILQGVWFFYEFGFGNREAAKNIFKGFIAVGILYVPWLYPLYNQTKMVGGGFWLGTPTIKDLLGLFAEYLAYGIKNNLAQPALILVITGLLIRNWKTDIKKSLFVLSWFIFPIAATWIISQVFQSIFFNRYLLYAIPGSMVLLASNRRRAASMILLGIILGLFIKIDYHYFTNPTKRPFKQLSAFVKSELQEGDFLINWNAGSHHLWETKYYGIPAPLYIPGGGELPFFVGTALMESEDIIHTIPENTLRVGVITSGNIDEVELASYTKVRTNTFGDLKFIWYEK